MSREQRDRMTETFAAVRDALQRAAVPTYGVVMGKMPDLPRPWYLPEAPPQTVGQYRAALAKLGRLGIVKERIQ
jgi:hypothetical protein